MCKNNFRKPILIILFVFIFRCITYSDTILSKDEHKNFCHIISIGAVQESWYYSNSFYVNKKSGRAIFSISYYSFLKNNPTEYLAKFRLDFDVNYKWLIYSFFGIIGHKQLLKIYSYSLPLSYYFSGKGEGIGIFLNYQFKNEKFKTKSDHGIILNLPVSLMPLVSYKDNLSAGFILYPQLFFSYKRFLLIAESIFSYAIIYQDGKKYFSFFPMISIGYKF